jgi:hypothetical protein
VGIIGRYGLEEFIVYDGDCQWKDRAVMRAIIDDVKFRASGEFNEHGELRTDAIIDVDKIVDEVIKRKVEEIMNRVKDDVQAIIEDITAMTEALQSLRERLEPIKEQCFGMAVASVQISLKDAEVEAMKAEALGCYLLSKLVMSASLEVKEEPIKTEPF